MKNLLKILGLTTLFSLGGLSLKAQELYFSNKEHAFVDTDNDSIPNLVLGKYDKNLNGKIDTYALFYITGRDSTHYLSSDRAFAVTFDKDEDGLEDLYFLDTDFDGDFDEIKERVIKKEENTYNI